MARPSYLGRRDGGRYYLQIRVGNPAKALYGRRIMRASLGTSDFSEARRRLVDSLGWARELIDAPDLEAVGAVIHARLQAYTQAGAPSSERALAERIGFEHQARHYMGRANERGFAFALRFEGFATKWVDFVGQNKATEEKLKRLDSQREYERVRAEAALAGAQGWLMSTPPSVTPPAAGPIALLHEVHQAIDAIVKSEVTKHAALALSAAVSPPRPSVSPNEAAQPASSTRVKLSEALVLYLEPQGKKRRHLNKGRQDAAAIVRFAIDLLGDPEFNKITKSDWDRLDEALTDIPNRTNIPPSHRGSLHLRYLYAQKHGWEGLARASVTTLKDRYQRSLAKFVAWAITQNLYHGELPKFECVDEDNLAPLPRDAFDDDELIKLISLPLFTGCANAFRVFKPGKHFLQRSGASCSSSMQRTTVRSGGTRITAPCL